MVVVSVLAACGGDPPIPRGTATPVIVLVRSGGIAGLTDRVSVDASGVATVVSDRGATPSTRTLTSSELATLRAALERSRIASLDRNYLDPRAADAYQFDVTYQGVTVTADEGVVPARLRPVVEQLTKLIVG